MLSIKSCLRRGVAITAAVPIGLISLAVSAQTNPNAITLPNGANLSVQIDDPLQDMEFKVPAASGPGGAVDVPVAGEASVGQGVPNAHVTFVVDVSGSTGAPCQGAPGTILDCEKQAVLNVLADPNITSVLDIGVTVFATSGASADMAAAAGNQPLTGNLADVTTVVNSISSGQVGQFTLQAVGFGTDFATGLAAAQSSTLASSAATRRVFYLSDGLSAQNVAAFNAALAPFVAAGVTIDSFAVGGGSACTPAAPFNVVTLQAMADATSGTCTFLPDPAQILAALPNLVATSLDAIQVAVDGGNVTTNTIPALPAAGPIAAMYDALPNLGIGDFNVTATADGSDSSGMSSITADVDVHLLQLAASPANASNELGADQAHSVNGAILGGTGPDRNIDFSVGGQNAATATPGNGSSLATPGGGAVSFSYTVPASCDSLGQDTITVSTTIAGMIDSIVVTKDWVDTITPEATCEPAENPHGKNEPSAPGNGGQGQNQDGFYQLLATDNLVDGCDPLVINAMDADGFMFGPFGVGDIIKYTQSDGAAQQEKKMGSTDGGNNGNSDAVTAHLKGHGDLTISATDGAGNTGPTATCLVPKPPK